MKNKKTFRFTCGNNQITLIFDKESLFVYTKEGTREYFYDCFILDNWSSYRYCYSTYERSESFHIYFVKDNLNIRGDAYAVYINDKDWDYYNLKNLDTRLKFISVMRELTNNFYIK